VSPGLQETGDWWEKGLKRERWGGRGGRRHGKRKRFTAERQPEIEKTTSSEERGRVVVSSKTRWGKTWGGQRRNSPPATPQMEKQDGDEIQDGRPAFAGLEAQQPVVRPSALERRKGKTLRKKGGINKKRPGEWLESRL